MQPQPAAETAPTAGNEHIAAVHRELALVSEAPLADHPEVFGRVHAHLQQALAGIDDA